MKMYENECKSELKENEHISPNSSNDEKDSVGKEMLKRDDSFYMIRRGDDLQRFDSADWALEKEREKARECLDHKNETKCDTTDGVDGGLEDREIDFDEEPNDDVFSKTPSREGAAGAGKVVSRQPSLGAHVTARRLLSKSSSGSSSGEFKTAPPSPPTYNDQHQKYVC
jgi:hypothetical protein